MPPEHEPPVEAQLRQANKMEALTRFARGVAHDFNNVFTAIAGNSDLLLADLAPDDPRRSEVQAIRDAVTRGTTLTRQLFTLSGQLPTAPDSVDLNALVHGLERELARLAGDRVALATVYGIVKRSDGFVWVYSELGVGTSVKVYLPRTDTVAPVAAPKHAPVASLRGTETVLLVEDEDAVRAVARQVLARYGYAVIEVAGPEEALALTETTQGVDPWLTDIVMPGVGGRALAAQFTARRPGTRVLFMSGYPDAAIGRHQMLERGLAFLQKPFSAEALARKVREVLG